MRLDPCSVCVATAEYIISDGPKSAAAMCVIEVEGVSPVLITTHSMPNLKREMQGNHVPSQ